ncbi:MAG: ATP-dependent protease ATPase subunit HslU [Fusobacteriaceae bacterium]|jgi:ATP-dependent HslUV protease ATP-binding subunit HslU|nr:ATP-dependent protease ATPase subunit HslU [Fusobacteriaceae bacterium]
MNKKIELTPKNIVNELNRYIISQEEAKKSVAISLKNRDRRKNVNDINMRNEITPKNVILIGPTGVGKTEIARRIAKIVNAPFIKVEATKYTEVGYVGKDVESIIRDLVEITFRKMKEEMYNELRTKSQKIAYKKIAKILKPYDTLNDKEKLEVIDDIKNGKYNNYEIEIEKKIKPIPLPIIEIVGGNIDENSNIGNVFEQMISNLDIGASKEKMKMTVKDGIKRYMEEDIEKHVNIDLLKEKVIENVENNGIVFIDEIDKISERGGIDRGDVSRQGVQRDILPIIEGSTIMTQYGPVKTDHILFIAAGAFTQSSPSDMMPELQGRFPIKVKLKNLEKIDFIKILTEVEYNLLDQYKAMLLTDNVVLNFSKSAIESISEIAVKLNESIENIGARRLATVVEKVLKDILFDAPYETDQKINIDGKFVKKIFRNEDAGENLDKFIL